MSIILIIIVLLIPVLGFFIFKKLRGPIGTPALIFEYLVFVAFIISFLLFIISWIFNSADYYTAIDIVDGGYTPFAGAHLLTFIVFFVFSVLVMVLLWLRGTQLPPLVFVFSIIFLLLGVALNILILIQAGSNTESGGFGTLFMFFPICYIVVAIALFTKAFLDERGQAITKVYKSKFLNYLNLKMANSQLQPVWVIVLLVPVFIIITAILILFGQDHDSIAKVFTETTTWTFSQKTHPPFLEHSGHYLCTVAVCGSPNIVKPLRLGIRHGHEIVVNRQLLIANAFEELVQDKIPRLHKIIRSAYDKYGYPLSKKITTQSRSNFVYRCMKPLEYFFLFILYLFCLKPERRIAKQYCL